MAMSRPVYDKLWAFKKVLIQKHGALPVWRPNNRSAQFDAMALPIFAAIHVEQV